jgi:hypothetical protein
MVEQTSKEGLVQHGWKTRCCTMYLLLTIDKDCFFSVEINCIFRLYLCSATFSFFFISRKGKKTSWGGGGLFELGVLF